MRTLSIRFAKKPDGTTVLTCTRADGSRTWQRRQRHAAFFALHDLSHYVVETTLGLRHGFYGLLASGWSITDFGEREIPAHAACEAALAEAVVGLLDGERVGAAAYDADGFNAALAASLGQMDQPCTRPVTAEELDAMRARFMELAGRWARVPAGGEMVVAFELAPGSAA